MTAKKEFSTTDGSLYRLFIPINMNLSASTISQQKKKSKNERRSSLPFLALLVIF